MSPRAFRNTLAALIVACVPMPLWGQTLGAPVAVRTDSTVSGGATVAWPAVYDSSRAAITICAQVRVAGVTKTLTCRSKTGPWVRHIVTAPPITIASVAITPKTDTVLISNTRQYSATITWSDGTTLPLVPQWGAAGGSITSGGVYTAGTVPGTYAVTATVQNSTQTKADTARITVKPVPPPPPPPSTKFVIGDAVQASASINVRSAASLSATLLGTQSTGALGNVLAGPIAAGGYAWWSVDYPTAPDGWSAENLLAKASAPPPPPPPPPPPDSGWLPVVTLSGGYIAAAGQRVIAAAGDGTLSTQFSADEGATFSPFTPQGAGTLYLEHPIAVSGQTVGIATVAVSSTITDFCCPRPVGDIYVRRSTDGGASYSAPIRVTTGKRALRLSLAQNGTTWHLTYMTWTGSTWDIEYARSLNDGVSWSAPVVIANGTNGVGAERPGIALSGSRVYVTTMDARDNLASCAIEGGTLLPNCTEIYVVVSADNGTTWAAPRRLTNDVPYSGRPDATALSSTVAIVYDHRITGTSNDIGLLVTRDDGVTWTQSLLVSAPGDQTHAVITVSATRGWHVTWMDSRSGSARIWAKSSPDLTTWSAEEQVSFEGAVGAPSAGLTDNALHVSWGESVMKYRRKLLGAPPPPPLESVTNLAVSTTRLPGDSVETAVTFTQPSSAADSTVVRLSRLTQPHGSITRQVSGGSVLLRQPFGRGPSALAVELLVAVCRYTAGGVTCVERVGPPVQVVP